MTAMQTARACLKLEGAGSCSAMQHGICAFVCGQYQLRGQRLVAIPACHMCEGDMPSAFDSVGHARLLGLVRTVGGGNRVCSKVPHERGTVVWQSPTRVPSGRNMERGRRLLPMRHVSWRLWN